ncbi:BSP-domain-containing protein [Trichoderma citrinoviride]|uniref:BSP-domain-containing protein n=1 Tax=Trichoderma citrinoviride TaxID=58853 RepID=A0A2T4BNB2_9HYPO|nr:BSP-domain-containing protein [Trichoderma citrinoviride]PTB70780.1 BSP-domain-containing protein [Trichoderma citrinoviride]
MTLIPKPSPLPPSSGPDNNNTNTTATQDHKQEQDQTAAAAANEAFPQPPLNLRIANLAHPGASLFLSSTNPSAVIPRAIGNLLRLLYGTPSDPSTTPPPTSSVTLVLEDFNGVAYTVGAQADSNVKEIHFSESYIARVDPSRVAREIDGVLTHELVHCFQYNGRGTAPGGLIEGIADWVRLRCGLAPPHWKQEVKDSWDAGYQHTAYFLDYLERRFGNGTVRRINEKLRVSRYDERVFWTSIFGQDVKTLFADYTRTLRQSS